MSRNLVWILIVIAVIGGAVLLSRIDASKKLTTVEKAIPENALAR